MKGSFMRAKTAVVVAAAVAGLLMAGEAKASVAYDASLAAPGTYFGTGNAGTTNWTTDTEGNVEVGLNAILRYVGPITPTPTNSATYYVPLGGSPPGHTGSFWGFDFSFNGLATGSGTAVTLNEITTKLTMTDVANHTTGSFDVSLIPDNDKYGPHGKDSASDSTATQYGFQNSETLSFGSVATALGDPLFNPNQNDTYHFTFSIMEGDTLLASVSDTVIAGTGVPEPATLSVLALGCVGLLGVRRRRAA